MAVVAQSGTDCRDRLRQHGHSQRHSGVDQWLAFFTSDATLERWRSDRIGPVFLKILGRVLYRHVDIEAF